MLRPSALARSTAAAAVHRARDGLRSTRRSLSRFAHPRAFAVPRLPAAAASRAARNLSRFRLYYAVLLWISLLSTLAPTRPSSVVFLMAASKVAAAIAALLRSLPASSLLNRIVDRRLAAALFLIVVVVQLVIADAVGHLAMSLAFGAPVVLAHAVFRVEDDPDAAAEGEPGRGAAADEKKDGGESGDLEGLQ